MTLFQFAILLSFSIGVQTAVAHVIPLGYGPDPYLKGYQMCEHSCLCWEVLILVHHLDHLTRGGSSKKILRGVVYWPKILPKGACRRLKF